MLALLQSERANHRLREWQEQRPITCSRASATTHIRYLFFQTFETTCKLLFAFSISSFHESCCITSSTLYMGFERSEEAQDKVWPNLLLGSVVCRILRL